MNKETLRLALPNIISNISVPLLSTVDTALMGRLSEVHIAAVGVGAMLFNFIYWNFGFLRMGTTGITAQAFGRMDSTAIGQTLWRALLIVASVACFLIIFQTPICKAAFWLLNVSEEQLPLVNSYFRIRIWAAPASLGLFACMGWFFGMQNAIYPLLITLIVNAVNVVLNFVLVLQFKMDADGVAYSTLIAQYVGLCVAVGLLWYKYRSYLVHTDYRAVLAWKKLRAFLLINRDIFIRTLCLTLSFALFYNQSAKYGDLILATNVILLQFVNWMSYAIDGFAYAAESLVGKYHGARQSQQTQDAVRTAFIWAMVLAGVFSGIYLFLGTSILHLFTNQTDVIATALPYLFWMTLFPLFSTPCYIWDGVFIGLTASVGMRNSMLVAFGIFLIAIFTLPIIYQNHGLWAALLLFLFVRGAFQQWLYQTGRI
ncbi:MAG: MATE family efflux transporter [Bacteroidota bacterium]